MSSCELGGASARMPSQANGYSRSYTVSSLAMAGRQTPWKPSQPAM